MRIHKSLQYLSIILGLILISISIYFRYIFDYNSGIKLYFSENIDMLRHTGYFFIYMFLLKLLLYRIFAKISIHKLHIPTFALITQLSILITTCYYYFYIFISSDVSWIYFYIILLIFSFVFEYNYFCDVTINKNIKTFIVILLVPILLIASIKILIMLFYKMLNA